MGAVVSNRMIMHDIPLCINANNLMVCNVRDRISIPGPVAPCYQCILYSLLLHVDKMIK